jgi:hypothetical protein
MASPGLMARWAAPQVGGAVVSWHFLDTRAGLLGARNWRRCRCSGISGATVGCLKFVTMAAWAGLLVLTAACTGPSVSRAATSPVADPSISGIGVGRETTVASGFFDADHMSSKASFMQFPFAESFPSAKGGGAPRVVLVSFSEQVDSRFYPERLRTERSVDGGKTFTRLATGVPINSMTRLVDGSLVAVDFRTATPVPTRSMTAPPRGSGVKQFQTRFWRSHDDGVTWVEHHGSIAADVAYDAVYFHRDIVAGRDGAILATTYGYLHGQHKYRSMLARSTDRGATWRIVSTIAMSPAGWRIEGRSEPTIVRAASGELVVVMRQSAPVNIKVCNGSRQGAGLVISRSSNDGASWTPARSLVGAGLDFHNVSSADPHLTRMPGGQLILSYGRPGNKILISANGNGTSWSNLTLTETGTSSGSTSIVPLTRTAALQLGDHGSNWCFPAGSGLHKVGIWAKTIDLRLSDMSRPDRPGRHLSGSVNVVKNLTNRSTAAAGWSLPATAALTPCRARSAMPAMAIARSTPGRAGLAMTGERCR